jgi:hypothetical protein
MPDVCHDGIANRVPHRLERVWTGNSADNWRAALLDRVTQFP